MVSFSAPKIPALAEARLVGALLVVASPLKGRHKACPYRPHRGTINPGALGRIRGGGIINN